MSKALVFVALAVAVVVALAACGGASSSNVDASNSFLAFNPAFAPFRTWTSFHSDGPVDDGTQPAIVLGPRTQYINKIPPAGSTEFSIGTIIVEARDNGKIFAMVKRGGNFNAAGTINWENFELTENPVQYVWRGLGPPLGDTYGGDPNGCNMCHVQCVANDYICSPKLQLTGF